MKLPEIPELIKSPIVLALVVAVVAGFMSPVNEVHGNNFFDSAFTCAKGGNVWCWLMLISVGFLLVYSLIAFIRGVFNMGKD